MKQNRLSENSPDEDFCWWHCLPFQQHERNSDSESSDLLLCWIYTQTTQLLLSVMLISNVCRLCPSCRSFIPLGTSVAQLKSNSQFLKNLTNCNCLLTLYLLWLKMIIWVTEALRKTVVCGWRFDNQCWSYLQSQGPDILETSGNVFPITDLLAGK